MLTTQGIIDGYQAVIAVVPGTTQINYWLGIASGNAHLTNTNFPQTLAVEVILNPSANILAGFPANYITLKIRASQYHQIDDTEEVVSAMANWESPLLERLTFETDILVSRNGTEQRIQRRSQARTVLEYDFLLYNSDLNHFQNFVNDAQGRKVFIPVWSQMVKIGDGLETIPLLRAGTYLLFAGYRYREVVTITPELTFLTPPTMLHSRETWLIPLEKGSVRDRVQFDLITGKVAKGSVQAIMESFAPVKRIKPVETTPFGAVPWFHTEPNWSSTLGAELTRPTGLLDYGGKTTAYDLHGFSDTVHTGQFLCSRKSYSIRDFFLDMKGRQHAFYMPSFKNDLDITAVNDHTDYTRLVVKNVGFANYTYTKTFVQHLLIELKGKPAIIAKIKSALLMSGDYEEIRIEKQDLFTAAEVTRVSYITLTRFNIDALECTWITPEWYTTSASFISIKK